LAYIYVAGPLFNTHERWYLEQVTEALEAAGHRTFLPHRDAGLLPSLKKSDRQTIFEADMTALNECNMCVAVLTGADHDSGTSAELGYMYAQSKPCFGVSDDLRGLNNLIWGLCGQGQHIVKTIDELIPLIERNQA
jgi:nucleoside 2-deoxyribosyltransferase